MRQEKFQGPNWHMWSVNLNNSMVSEAFQLVFVAKRGKSYLSDIIIETVNLHVNDSLQCRVLRYT